MLSMVTVISVFSEVAVSAAVQIEADILTVAVTVSVAVAVAVTVTVGIGVDIDLEATSSERRGVPRVDGQQSTQQIGFAVKLDDTAFAVVAPLTASEPHVLHRDGERRHVLDHVVPARGRRHVLQPHSERLRVGQRRTVSAQVDTVEPTVSGSAPFHELWGEHGVDGGGDRR